MVHPGLIRKSWSILGALEATVHVHSHCITPASSIPWVLLWSILKDLQVAWIFHYPRVEPLNFWWFSYVCARKSSFTLPLEVRISPFSRVHFNKWLTPRKTASLDEVFVESLYILLELTSSPGSWTWSHGEGVGAPWKKTLWISSALPKAWSWGYISDISWTYISYIIHKISGTQTTIV